MSLSSARDKIRGIRAWVSGGTGALGLAFARALLSHGASVVILADLRAPAENELLPANKVHFHYVDVRSDSTRHKEALTIAESLAQARSQHGGLDLIVNNAGLLAEVTDATTLAEAMKKTMSVNLKAMIEATEIGAQALKDGGIIVNISSAAGVFPAPEAPLYAAAKAGVVMYSRARAKALIKQGVRLNALCPAWVNAGVGKEAEKAPNWRRLAEVVGVMQPADVANALLQIVCDQQIVGQAVYVSRKTGVCFPLRGLRPVREAKL